MGILNHVFSRTYMSSVWLEEQGHMDRPLMSQVKSRPSLDNMSLHLHAAGWHTIGASLSRLTVADSTHFYPA